LFIGLFHFDADFKKYRIAMLCFVVKFAAVIGYTRIKTLLLTTTKQEIMAEIYQLNL
jgi:hypothetical protein